MFAGFTDRLNFGMGNGGGGAVSIPSTFPTRPIAQLGNFNTFAINFISASGITASEQQSAINQLSTDLVNTGLINKMVAIYPFVGGTADLHKWNLKDPRDADTAFRLTFFGGATHSSTGYFPSASNGYANTFCSLASGSFNSSNLHMSVYCRTNSAVTANRQDISVSNAVSTFYQISAAVHFFAGNGTTGQGGVLFTTTNDTRGYWCGSKPNNSTRFGFRNGVLNTAVTSTNDTTVAINFPVFLGARNANGTATLFSGRELAFATIGTSLTQQECATLYTIVQNFQTTLGRQV